MRLLHVDDWEKVVNLYKSNIFILINWVPKTNTNFIIKMIQIDILCNCCYINFKSLLWFFYKLYYIYIYMINFGILRIIDFDEFGNLEYNLSMKSIFFYEVWNIYA